MTAEHFNAVIVGSGFGGSVMAYRLAEAKLSVCVLERGKAYPPHSFPRSPYKVKAGFWDPSDGLYGLFDFWSFRGFSALVSSGLGGGSLIYANVLKRKDENWFVKEDLASGGYEYWPVTYKDLEPHYEQVERMMNPQEYPVHLPPYNETYKTLAMREAAAKLGLEYQILKLAVTFSSRPGRQPVPGEPIYEEPGHENLHGRTRLTCILCGECDMGCNYGSKNTLDYNYLSEAKRLGAEIRTLCEVRRFEKEGSKFNVHYVAHDLAREGRKFNTQSLPQTKITCDSLILAGGTFGTPYLLLKNRSAFPNISRRLGSRFCVNGDLLSMIRGSRRIEDGRRVPRTLDASFGPTITSTIRMPDALDGQSGRGFYVQEGGYPVLGSWLVDAATDVPGYIRRTIHFVKRAIAGYLGWNRDRNLGSELSALLGQSRISRSTIPVLSMGRDIPNGTMDLRGKYLEVDWRVKNSQEYYNRVVETVRRIAGALDATYRDNLPYSLLRQIVTTHPLGGCPMGRNKEEGVVDSNGQVFDYPGLYIVDGSMMPGPVGPNPSLTIAALSDRFANHIISNSKGGPK